MTRFLNCADCSVSLGHPARGPRCWTCYVAWTRAAAAARLEQRFGSKVDRSGGPDACHPWLGHRDKDGYGTFSMGRARNSVRATHVALTLAGRPLALGEQGMHTCDNPPCVNDSHLVAGTNADNVADRDAKGRQARGDRHGMRRRLVAA